MITMIEAHLDRVEETLKDPVYYRNAFIARKAESIEQLAKTIREYLETVDDTSNFKLNEVQALTLFFDKMDTECVSILKYLEDDRNFIHTK